MENIHDLDGDQIYNIKEMLNSWNVDNIRMALVLLNNANYNNPNMVNHINYLMNECVGLRFAIYTNNVGDYHRVRFHFEGKRLDPTNFNEKTLFVDDETTSETIDYKLHPYPLNKISINQ